MINSAKRLPRSRERPPPCARRSRRSSWVFRAQFRPVEVRNYRSVWIMIGALWISATLVVVGATGAILYLFG